MEQGCTLQPPPNADVLRTPSPTEAEAQDIERRRRRLSGYDGGQWAGIELETVVQTSSAEQAEELTQMLRTPEVIYGSHIPPPLPPSPPPPPPPVYDDIERRRARRLLGSRYNAEWVYGVPNVTAIATSSTTGELLLFAVTSASSCAESLAYGPDAISENSSSAYLSTEHRDVLHTRWRQVLKADGTSARATIEWVFYDEKTLQERFEAAAAAGERVRWSVTDETQGTPVAMSGTCVRHGQRRLKCAIRFLGARCF
eukprot:gene2880-3685_t